MTYHFADFPFDELDRFDTTDEAIAAGYTTGHIWSVVEGDEYAAGVTYGPPHHYINRLYVIVTAEAHDHDTYYEEEF
jgi:hypothetical protein